MKIPTVFLAAVIFVCLAFTSFAADTPKASPEVKAAVTSQLFRAGEIQFDAFFQTRTRDMQSFEHGGGGRLTYFLYRSVGVSIEGRTENPKSAFFDRIGANLVGRLPVEKLRIAPEFRLGFDWDAERRPEDGEQKGRTGFDLYAGIGGELRLTKNLGLFAEVRGVRPIETAPKEYLAGLGGVRLSF